MCGGVLNDNTFFRIYIYFPFWDAAAAAAKSLQSCPTLCDSIDGSPPDSHVPRILQARTLEWIAISFSNATFNYFVGEPINWIQKYLLTAVKERLD